MSAQIDELKARVEAKVLQLQAQIATLRGDAKGQKNDAIEAIQKKLDEVQEHAKESWESLSDAMAKKLNDWLK